MSDIDIYEIANYCVEQYKNSLSNKSDKKYDSSEFFAITDDNQVLYSATPHLLKVLLSASSCTSSYITILNTGTQVMI